MKITIKNLQKKIPINPLKIKEAALRALSRNKKNLSGEISIYCVNDRKIKEINKKFLKRNRATDVISFDLSGGKKEILADIFVSLDTACRNARIFHTFYLDELLLYVIHGVLHLIGYDDKTPKQKVLMCKRQKAILSCLSIRPKP